MIDSFISKSLSRQVLIMAIAFVMIAEIVILIPSAAVFRQDWLEDRGVRAGHISLALTGVPNYEGSEMLSEQFMKDTDIVMLLAKREGMTELVLGSPPDGQNFENIDLRRAGLIPSFWNTAKTIFGRSEGYLQVRVEPIVAGQDVLEYIVPKTSIRSALMAYIQRILLLSLAIALITGFLLYLALALVIVRPIEALVKGLGDFRQDPELRRSNLPPSRRRDEIGELQREFFDMKQSVRSALKQQERLATLGLAVAKINHDLRNVLTSAQLVSDRLAMDKEERVANMGQRLVRAVDRGVKLCADVLSYSQSKEDPPEKRQTRISLLIGEAASDALDQFTAQAPITFKNNVPTHLTLSVDPDHTYRIFHNLFRNAGQVLVAMKDDPKVIHEIVVRCEKLGDKMAIHVEDTGPGLPDKAQENLFKAFMSSSTHGSTGLGLTISKELARDQGGDLVLTSSSDTGTVFTVLFAASAVPKT